MRVTTLKQNNMKNNRRHFLKNGLTASAALSLGACASTKSTTTNNVVPDKYALIDQAAQEPIFKKELFPDPVILESVELLNFEHNYICRVRSTDGAEGLSVSCNFRMRYLYPIQVQKVNPFFVGKDARDLDALMEGIYLYQNNYKLQNMAYWIPVATVELAILDLMGKIANKPMGELIGDTKMPRIPVYRANNYRGQSAEQSVANILKVQQESGAKAVKFKIGGRMANEEKPVGRTERMIPMMRKTFGDDIAIYADANGSYDAKEGIRIGKLLEANGIDLYEGPVPFDWYEDIKTVADAVDIPLAGGGQEASMRNFRWLIANDAFQTYQQDIFYFGGMIRCMKVAKMAAAAGHTCMPHISGSGIGFLYMLHFVSVTPNADQYHEFKGFTNEVPFECPTSSLAIEDGRIKVPTGAGNGVVIDPDFLAKHKVI